MKRAVFRVDASSQIGTGHVMRCLNLARELRNKKFEILFICRDFPGNLNGFIREQEFEICVLPAPSLSKKSEDFLACLSRGGRDDDQSVNYAEWLGVPWEQDAEETLETFKIISESVDLLIIDHYGLDARWERKFKNKAKKILVIDDLANRPHDCDFLLDQNLVISSLPLSQSQDCVGADLCVRPDKERYKNLVSSTCQCLLGPNYALLNPAVLKARKDREQYFMSGEEFKSCLVFMGGTDPDNFSQALALNLLKIFPTLKIYLIIGRANLNFSKLKAEFEPYKNIEILIQPENYFNLLTQVDFVVGGSGSSTWERCCIGVPSFFFQIADNQKDICESVSQIQAGVFLGDLKKLKTAELVGCIEKIVEFAPLDLERMAAVGKALVDGLGVMKVSEACCL